MSVGPRPLVAHVIDRLPPDGAERLLADVLKFRSDDFDFVVVCLIGGGMLKDVIEEYGVPVVVMGCRNGWDPRILFRLSGWIRRNRPAIVHTHLFTADAWGRLVANMHRIPGVMTTVHSTNDWKQWYHRAVDRWLARWSSTIFACTEAVKMQLVGEFAIHLADRIVAVENGVDIDRVLTLASQPIDEIGGDGQCVAIIGRLHEAKGHGTLFEATSLMKEEGLTPTILVIGDGPLHEVLLAQAMKLGIEDQVCFLGFQDNPFAYLRQVEVVAMPSNWEGLPMALLEVMAVGVPVVASDVGGIGTVLTDGVNGLLVPPGQPRPLANKLKSALVDAGMRKTIGQASRETVRSLYDVKRVAIAYEESYQRVLSTGGDV